MYEGKWPIMKYDNRRNMSIIIEGNDEILKYIAYEEEEKPILWREGRWLMVEMI